MGRRCIAGGLYLLASCEVVEKQLLGAGEAIVGAHVDAPVNSLQPGRGVEHRIEDPAHLARDLCKL